MKYSELDQIARTLDAATMHQNLCSLAADRRFAAVIALLLRYQDAATPRGSAELSNHGQAAGILASIMTVQQLQDELQDMIDRPPESDLSG